MKDQENQNKQLKQIKVAIGMVLVTILISVICISLVVKKGFEASVKQDQKVEHLIDEVGDLRQSNDELTAASLNKDQKINAIVNSVNSLSSSHAAAENQKTAQQNLEDILQAKDSTINELASKNKDMQDVINLPPYSDKILNFLIVGQNLKLTDTIIIASIDPDKQKITLVSIPRDLYYKGRRINELYEFYGVGKLEEAIYNVTGLSISRYVIFDFDSFKTIVDSLGGIEINIKKAFIDYNYPGPKRSYTTVSFKQGLQTMNGDLALKYARSRKSTSDFDRSRRQQQIIQAVVKKAGDQDLINKIDLSLKIYEKIISNIETDVNFFEALGYFNNYRNFTINSVEALSTSNYLYSTTGAAGQYMLLPKAKDFNQIKKYIYDNLN